MKKKIRSVIMIILTFLVFISSGISTSAYEGGLDDKEESLLLEQIDFVENNYVDIASEQKNDLILKVEYSVGDSVSMYEYTSENLIKKCDFLCYPVFKNNHLKYFLIVGEDGSGVQLTDCLVDILTKYYENGTPIALLYDQEKNYVLTSKGIDEENKFNELVLERGQFKEEVLKQYPSEIQYTAISPTHILRQSFTADAKGSPVPYNVSLPVSYVSQNPPSNICWAASVACIGNYLTGRTYSATDIAKGMKGNNWNQAANFATAMYALSNYYGVNYNVRYENKVPTTAQINNNLKAGFPIYTHWSWSGGTHATVIRGIQNSTLYIMDPEFGFTASLKNKSTGKYTYISGYSGVTLTFKSYCSSK